MRHLCGLDVWNDVAWREGDTAEDRRVPTNWAAFVQNHQRGDVIDADE